MGLLMHAVLCICTSTSHFWTLLIRVTALGTYLLPGPHIRLMVDVLLTMNEAFCVAGVAFSRYFA